MLLHVYIFRVRLSLLHRVELDEGLHTDTEVFCSGAQIFHAKNVSFFNDEFWSRNCSCILFQLKKLFEKVNEKNEKKSKITSLTHF